MFANTPEGQAVKVDGLRAGLGAVAGVDVTLESGQQIRAPMVIGADGVRSKIAQALGLGEANFAGYIAYRLAACRQPSF